MVSTSSSSWTPSATTWPWIACGDCSPARTPTSPHTDSLSRRSEPETGFRPGPAADTGCPLPGRAHFLRPAAPCGCFARSLFRSSVRSSSVPSASFRIARTVLAAAIAVSGAAAATAVTTTAAHAAPAASSVDGQISRSEVIARAQYWLGKSIPYNQGASYPDQGGRSYRTDCSGYVSMAWHLGTSATTQTLPGYSHEISRSDLRAGDILNSFYDHVLLFDKWDDAAHTTFSYYSFGSTPVKHVTGKSINAAEFDSHPNGDYKALRYDKIVDDAPAYIATHDFSGDGRDDLLGISGAGELKLFGTRSDLSLSSSTVGSGWATKDMAAATDFNGDGRGDIVAADRVTGDLSLWTGRGDGTFNSAVKIGDGWTNMAQLAAGDFDGDGKGDVIGITKDTAKLELFTSTGSGLTGPKVLGTGGWANVKNLAAGDFTGDGKADIVATNSATGELSLYPSNGSGLNGSGVIGTSFQTKDKLTMADLNKDGKSDIVAADRATGDLTIYASNGSVISDTKKIGDGWASMTNL
ncbi:hypothetical protein GTY54_00675, partial [Streptomyces sp. SID625]|nr:hypothetical protein [Streptomyces sp. SID625]